MKIRHTKLPLVHVFLRYCSVTILGINYFISILGFSERGREGRLIRLVSDTMEQDLGTTMSVGVDENTALVVYNVAGATQYGEVN